MIYVIIMVKIVCISITILNEFTRQCCAIRGLVNDNQNKQSLLIHVKLRVDSIFVLYVSVTENESRIYYGNWFGVQNKYFLWWRKLNLLLFNLMISERFGEGAASLSIISKYKLNFAHIIIVFLIWFVFLKCNDWKKVQKIKRPW